MIPTSSFLLSLILVCLVLASITAYANLDDVAFFKLIFFPVQTSFDHKKAKRDGVIVPSKGMVLKPTYPKKMLSGIIHRGKTLFNKCCSMFIFVLNTSLSIKLI